jgi:hypothetical protein
MTNCISSFYVDFKLMHDRMIKSLTHFHPDVNLETVKRDDYLKLSLTTWGYPILELPLFKRYETVTHLDADVIIVDKIDELWNPKASDFRAGRNNTDNKRCAKFVGVTLPDIGWDVYVNAGIHSCSNPAFMEEWLTFSQEHIHEYRFGENDTMNVIFHNGKYKTKILDPVDQPVLWGTSLVEGRRTYWDIWKKIIIAPEGDHLELNGKRIKLLHMAGGLPTRPALEYLVTPNVAEWINDTVLAGV